MGQKCDFSGWATRNDLRCSDGRTIRKNAFKHNDGQKVPLVWNHQHNDPFNVLGHAMLENREEGVYAYCTFNDTESAQAAKETVKHGDIVALSIFANKLKEHGSDVVHGAIREVSLVIAGANPGAFIDTIAISHGEESDGEAIIYTGLPLVHAEEAKKDEEAEEVIEHNSDDSDEETVENVIESMTEKQQNVMYTLISQAMGHSDEDDSENLEHSDDSELNDEDIEEVINTMTEKQKNAMHILIGMVAKNNNKDSEGGENMKHNVFDQDGQQNENVISHSDLQAVIADAKRHGSLRESALAHGITDIQYLYPYGPEDGRNVTDTPQMIQRDMGWVQKVMRSVHHTPFSRIKSILANITEEDARAKGYIKGKLKKEEVFKLLKRTTSPTTVYKKQKIDRDDYIDITDFNVVSFLKAEMRTMLDEELARAYLIGDGRDGSSDDKINELNIRPIWTDEDLYTVKAPVTVPAGASEEDIAKQFIKTAIKARKNYKGSGSPVCYMTEDLLTNCLLIEDTTGRCIYEDEAKLAKKLRVSEIVTVPVMEGATRTGDDGAFDLMAIIVNLNDYNVGADKGGAVSMFEDFDIDYNAQKYLIETRCSGALIKPFAAIAVELKKN